MFKTILKENILYFFFFASLILLDNHINSKVIIGICIIAAFKFNKDSFIRLLKLHYPLFIFFILVALSLTYSLNLKTGLKVVESLTIIPASILMFTFLSKRQISIKLLSLIFLGIVLIAAIYSHINVLFSFIQNNEPTYKHFFNLNYSYKALANTLKLHPTYYSLYILMAIVFILDLVQNNSVAKKYKIILFAIFLYFTIFLVQLSSRMAIGILYILILFNLVLYIKKNKKIVHGIALIIMFHIMIFTIVMNVGVTKYRFQHLLGFTYYTGYTVNDSSHKMKLWSAAINANENIIIGNGIGDIQSSLNLQYKKNNLKSPLLKEYNSHNQYIEYYVGLGIIGLSAFLFILFYYTRHFIKNKNFIALQFILIVAILSFTECLWNRHNGIVFIVFMLELLMQREKNKPKELYKLT